MILLLFRSEYLYILQENVRLTSYTSRVTKKRTGFAIAHQVKVKSYRLFPNYNLVLICC